MQIYRRILRALRFAIKYGFSIDKNTKNGMFSNLDNLDSVSKERITQELEKMLVCGKPIFNYFIEYVDIIVKIFPNFFLIIRFFMAFNIVFRKFFIHESIK